MNTRKKNVPTLRLAQPDGVRTLHWLSSMLLLVACSINAQEDSRLQLADSSNALTAPQSEPHGVKNPMNLGLELNPISDETSNLVQFKGKNLLLFYFSAKCSPCRTAFPHVQELAQKLTSANFSTVAVAVKNNSEDDIRSFIREYKCRIPVFHDSRRAFGEAYGTGAVPVLYLINGHGEYVRYENFDKDQTPEQMLTAASKFAKRP